jgi:hypothetical protein
MARRDGPAARTKELFMLNTLCCGCAVLFFLLTQAANAQAGDPVAPWAEAAALPDLTDAAPGRASPALFGKALGGQWRGTLEYRDFRTNQRVVLPTSADITGASDAMRLDFVFDDGPGKTVRSSEAWSLEGDAATLRMDQSGAPMTVGDYRAGIAGGNDFTLIATGEGTENGAAVKVRTVLLRRHDMLTISRATQLPGRSWLLRHAYRLTLAP